VRDKKDKLRKRQNGERKTGTDIHTYIHTYIHTDRQTDGDMQLQAHI
jgi:hypothetical protein